MWLLRDFFGPFCGGNPGPAEMEDCKSLVTRLGARKMAAEKYSVRHFVSVQQALEGGELDNAYRVPGTENPADGLTWVRCDMAPLLRLLESDHSNPGSLRPLGGVAWKEGAHHGKVVYVWRRTLEMDELVGL